MEILGGYDYNFVKEPPDTTICVICQLASRDPYLSVCCGHVFCKSCLDNAKIAADVAPDIFEANCPMCRVPSQEFVTVPNKQIDRLVRSLHVYCTNKEKGCQWQGEVNYISDHLGRSDGCDFEDFLCSNNCGQIVQRQYLVGHLEAECPRRMVTCQYCGVDGEYQLIDGEHKELCSKFPLPCPNNCDSELKVSREDMDTHRKECPLETVNCPYQCVGCDDVMVREYQREHNKENMEEHLALAVAELVALQQNTQRDLVTMKEELTESKLNAANNEYKLNQSLQIILQRLEQTEQELAATKTELISVKAAKDQLAQKLTKTENNLATVKKELTTTKHWSSVAYADVLLTKCPLLCDELTKMLTSLQENVDNINQMCENIDYLKDKAKLKCKEEVSSVDGCIDKSIDELQKYAYVKSIFHSESTFNQKKQAIITDFGQKSSAAKSSIEKSQKQLLDKVAQVEDDLTSIYQKFVEVRAAPLISAINELLPQVDNLIKDLNKYSEYDVIEKLDSVKRDIRELKNKFSQLKEELNSNKKKLETTKVHITASTNKLLQLLDDKTNVAKPAVKQICYGCRPTNSHISHS